MPGLFRLYFYDNFTKPLVPKGMTGRVVVEDNGKEIASFPLTPAKNGQTLEAQVKGAQLPLSVAAKVQFDAKTTEQRFDFKFDQLSIDVPSCPHSRRRTARPGAWPPLPERLARRRRLQQSLP